MEATNPLLEPYEYLLKVPGKNIRSVLVAAFDKWIKTDPERQKLITEIIDMLHTASLMVDDVEDNSELRRGVPVTHKIYGVAQTINSANYIYFLALQKVQQLGLPEAINYFTEELLLLHTGQGLDIYWRDNVKCPTIDEYLKMVSNKTGGLLRLAVKLMVATSTRTTAEDLNEYLLLVDAIGVHFQIRDDYVNLVSKNYHDSKGFAEDITEGKFSYPMVHCICNETAKQSILYNILRQKTSDVEVKKYAVSLLQKSLEHTRDLLVIKEREVLALITSMGGNDLLEDLMEKLADAYQ